MFALVDCNNFYASCERVFRPDLAGKPIVVLSNNDGCIVARSDEAKKLDIPMAAPVFKYRELLKEKNVHVFSSNYALYGDMSSRVMNILADMSPEIEIYSIDEAFLKFENCNYIDYEEYAEQIRKRVESSTGLSISIGFAPTKALAKVANSIAKKYRKKTNGAYVIDSDDKRIKALKWLPVEKIWGIGSRLAKRLKKQNVSNAYEFIQLSDEWVRKNMAVTGLRLKHDLEGKPSIDLDSFEKKKNIATTRSFEQDYTDYEDVKERIATFAISCAEKLRKQKTFCNSLYLFLHTNKHLKESSQYRNSIYIRLPFPTNSSIEISKFALKGLKNIFREGYKYKKAGVIVMDLSPEDEKQLTIFENSNEKHYNLMEVMDHINNTVGEQKVKLASQDLERQWKMNQEYLSPRYTTRLDEVMVVKS